MKLGGPLFGDASSPELWVAAARKAGYGALWCPVDASASEDVVHAYVKAAEVAGIVIAEVGAWSNPLSPNSDEAAKAIANCQQQLFLADRVGARCCVNISGSRGEQWDGPDLKNLTQETFDMIVEGVRTIIDAVKPTRTYYTLETMPWAYPDSADSYVRLLKAIDRERFAVHYDPVNLVCSPQRWGDTGAMIRDDFEKLGPYIKSCHAKDINLAGRLTVHLDETRPGLGVLDYRTFLRELDKLDPTVPLMIEHLTEEEDYRLSAEYIRSIADEVGVQIR
jgi:sugar phosphate isomerase/epimerase